MACPRSKSRASRASSRRKQPLTVSCQASPQSSSSRNCDEVHMLFLTRHFGVTGSAADRDPVREKAEIEEIVGKSLLLQAKSAAQQHRTIGRGTHVKGVCARAQFEVLDVAAGRDQALAMRLAKGMFAKPGVYPATVRFGNADPRKNSDFKADVRSLSFSVDLAQGTSPSASPSGRQDFSLQNTKTLPINDA